MRSIEDMMEVIQSRAGGLRVAPYEDALWPRLQRFLHEHWQPDHPLCHRELFERQYQGFGPAAGLHNCRVLLDGQEMAGFLGAIPGIYRLEGREVPGVALALWVVAEKYRNTGMGILLMHEVHKQGEVAVCLGVAPRVFKYYAQFGYRHLPKLHRWVAPLDAGAYVQLFEKPLDQTMVAAWAEAAASLPGSTLEPKTVDATELAELWRAGAGRWKLTLSRTPEFWTWRYRKAVGFEYVQFGGRDQGAVVARLDRISAPGSSPLNGRLVLRLIELLPGQAGPADGSCLPDGTSQMAEVLIFALNWSRRQGAIAADFQCSSTQLAPVLSQAGLRLTQANDPMTQLPELFNPLRHGVAPINLMVKASGWTEADFEASYLVKSDGDMDRPVRWPV